MVYIISKTQMPENVRSNSVYYHGDCMCTKKEVSTTIAIQCANCINNSLLLQFQCSETPAECTCSVTIIQHLICKTCALIRDQIDALKEELDGLLYTVEYEIKQYMDCNHKIDRIKKISVELQHCNRKLLENLVRAQE
jgi:hypothetical protein